MPSPKSVTVCSALENGEYRMVRFSATTTRFVRFESDKLVVTLDSGLDIMCESADVQKDGFDVAFECIWTMVSGHADVFAVKIDVPEREIRAFPLTSVMHVELDEDQELRVRLRTGPDVVVPRGAHDFEKLREKLQKRTDMVADSYRDGALQCFFPDGIVTMEMHDGRLKITYADKSNSGLRGSREELMGVVARINVVMDRE